MASGDLKEFYRQRKKGASAKPSASSKSTTIRSRGAASLADAVSSPSVFNPSDDRGEEEILRRFDLDMRYGPCIGMTRIARWERASAMGLNPPEEVRSILGREKGLQECVWDGRI